MTEQEAEVIQEINRRGGRLDTFSLLAEIIKYRDFARRLVACADGDGDIFVLAEEVRWALEDK